MSCLRLFRLFTRYVILCVCMGASVIVSAQQVQLQTEIDSIRFITNMPGMCYGEEHSASPESCQGTLFWSIVSHKLDAVPLLIDKLDDSTMTSAWAGPTGGEFAVGDIAYEAINEIIDSVPRWRLLGVRYSKVCGICAYWNYVRSDVRNRRHFQAAVRRWYLRHQSKLVWVPSMRVLTCDCNFDHPNGGHYVVRK